MKHKLLRNEFYSFIFLKNYFLSAILIIFSFISNNSIAQGTTCTTATPLTINGSCGSGSVFDAVQDLPNATGCGIVFQREGWFTFTVTGGPRLVTITATTSNTRDLALQLISSTGSCSGLTQIACANNVVGNIIQTETISSIPLSNGIYYIKAMKVGTNSNVTLASICVTAPTPPLNDNCAGAVSLTVNPDRNCGTVTAGTVLGATDSGIASSGCSGASGDDDDVWYRFVATGSTHEVSLTNIVGSNTDMYFAVYSGLSGCGSLGSAIICSDPNSNIISGLIAGQTYYIQVYTVVNSPQTTTFDICVGTLPTPPSNDSCINATPLTINPDLSCTSVTHGTLLNATSSGLTTKCDFAYDSEVWYSFTATHTTHYLSLLNVVGSNLDLSYGLYTGTCGSLTLKKCGYTHSKVITGLTIGQQYFLVIFTTLPNTTTTFDVCLQTPCNNAAPGTGTTTLGCPSVVSGGLGLNGLDPSPIGGCNGATCVDLEATYLDLGNTTTYTVESIPYAPPYRFGCLENEISLGVDDEFSPAINLPFNFCFFGNSYNQCTVGSNGIISFDMTNANGYSGYEFYNNLPSTSYDLFANTIYGVYHDLDPSIAGEIGWQIITLNTGCRALIISWHDVPMFSTNEILYTGMVVLYENTNIIEVYIEEKNIDDYNIFPWNDGNAIVGIQNSTATTAIVAPGRNGLSPNWAVTNEAWRFVPSGSSITSLTWYEGSGTSGPIIGTSDVITVCPTSTTTYTAAITYTLCNGSTLIETEETTVTVNGNKDWNGSVSSDWNNTANWTPAVLPTATDCVLIPVTPNDPIVGGSGYNALAGNLTIEDGAQLTITSNNNITVTDWINVAPTATFFIENSGSLIQVNNLATNTGNIIMERDVDMKKFDYVYWSSPVESFTSALISPLTPTNLIWKWQPTVPSHTNGYGIWVNGNESMIPGKGYIVRGPSTFNNTTNQTYTASFEGIANNGQILANIERGTYQGPDYMAAGAIATEDDDNWNLLGNPYPSAINAIDFLTTNTNIDGFIKIWTHGTLPSSAIVDPFYQDFQYNYTANDYITYNVSGVSAGPGVFGGSIASGQGFFTLMLDSGATSENVVFNNSMRSFTYDNSQFFRNSNYGNLENINNGRIWLDLVSPTQKNKRTLVAYVDGATNDSDRLFDAKTETKLNFNIYSLLEDNMFTIQGRQTPFNNLDKVNIGIKTNESGIHTMALGAVDGFFSDENQSIYLEDLELGIIHDIRQTPYAFTIEEGVTNDRFVLRYTKENEYEMDDSSDLIIYNGVQLSIFSSKKLKNVKIWNILGQTLANYRNINSDNLTFNSIQKNNSMLLIDFEFEDGTKLSKKVLY